MITKFKKTMQYDLYKTVLLLQLIEHLTKKQNVLDYFVID